MLRGLDTAAAGMVSQMLVQDTIANNLANVNTAGFKRTAVSIEGFSSLLLKRLTAGGGSQTVGNLSTGNRLRETALHWGQGTLQPTGNPLDVAIQGEGLLEVQTKEGEPAYTRNGALTLSADGTLMTQDGETVMNQSGGPIVIQAKGQGIQIDGKGNINVGGQRVGQLKLVAFDNPKSLTSLGGSLYASTDTPQPATHASISQGAIERGNVNIITEMVNSISGMRIYEALQKTIQAQNDALKQAVTDVGKVH